MTNSVPIYDSLRYYNKLSFSVLPLFHLFKNAVFAALLSQSVLTYSKSRSSFE